MGASLAYHKFAYGQGVKRSCNSSTSCTLLHQQKCKILVIGVIMALIYFPLKNCLPKIIHLSLRVYFRFLETSLTIFQELTMPHYTILMAQLVAGFISQYICYGDFTLVKNMSNLNLENVPYVDAEWVEILLDDNIISEIGPNGVAPATNRQRISLKNNVIRVIHDDAFASCTALLQVLLTNNNLVTLPANFGPNDNFFSFLYVDKNENLSVPQSYFSRYSDLFELDVSYTSIVIDDWKGLESLGMLFIDGLNYIPNLNGHPKLATLSAKNLQLRNIPNSHISNLPELVSLYFDSGIFQSSPVPSNVSLKNSFLVLTLSGSSRMTNIEDMTHIAATSVIVALDCPLDCGPGLCWYRIEEHQISIMASCVTPKKFDGYDIDALSPLDLRCYEGIHVSLLF